MAGKALSAAGFTDLPINAMKGTNDKAAPRPHRGGLSSKKLITLLGIRGIKPLHSKIHPSPPLRECLFEYANWMAENTFLKGNKK